MLYPFIEHLRGIFLLLLIVDDMIILATIIYVLQNSSIVSVSSLKWKILSDLIIFQA